MIRPRFGTVLVTSTLLLAVLAGAFAPASNPAQRVADVEFDDDPHPVYARSYHGFRWTPTLDPKAPVGPRTLRGRVIDEARQALKDVNVTFRFEPESRVRTRTDAEGRFCVTAPIQPGLAFAVVLDAEGYATSKWSWPPDEAYEYWRDALTRDAGNFELVRAGAIDGLVVDEEGKPSRQRLDITFQSERSFQGTNRMFETKVVKSDPATGQFTIRDAASGPGRLQAYPYRNPIYSGPERITVEPGVLTPGTLQVPKPPRTDELQLYLDMRYWGPRPSPEMCVLLNSKGESIAAVPGREFSLDFTFKGLDSSDYELRIDDPAYEPIRQRPLRASDGAVHVSLVGRGTLRLKVLDAVTGLDVPNHHATLEFGEGGSTRSMDLTQHWDFRPTGGLYTRVPIGAVAVTVTAGHYAPRTVRIAPLTSTDMREVVVKLERETPPDPENPTGLITCSLVQSDKTTPVKGQLVIPCLDSEPDAEYDGKQIHMQGMPLLTNTVGQVTFPNPGVGTLSAIPIDPAGTWGAMSQGLELRDSSESASLQIALPETIDIHGRLTLPPGFPTRRHALDWRLEGAQFQDNKRYSRPWSVHAIAHTFDNGDFIVRNLRAGTYRVSVKLTSAIQPDDEWNNDRHGIDLGRVVVGGTKSQDVSFDLTTGAFGSAEVLVKSPGNPLAFTRVRLTGEGEAPSVNAYTDAQGVSHFDVLPKRAYGIAIDNLEEGWSYRDPVPLTPASPAVRREIALVLTSTVVKVEDAAGELLRHTRVIVSGVFGALEETYERAMLVTDDSGTLTLNLPAAVGRITFELGDVKITEWWNASSVSIGTLRFR